MASSSAMRPTSIEQDSSYEQCFRVEHCTGLPTSRPQQLLRRLRSKSIRHRAKPRSDSRLGPSWMDPKGEPLPFAGTTYELSRCGDETTRCSAAGMAGMGDRSPRVGLVVRRGDPGWGRFRRRRRGRWVEDGCGARRPSRGRRCAGRPPCRRYGGSGGRQGGRRGRRERWIDRPGMQRMQPSAPRAARRARPMPQRRMLCLSRRVRLRVRPLHVAPRSRMRNRLEPALALRGLSDHMLRPIFVVHAKQRHVHVHRRLHARSTRRLRTNLLRFPDRRPQLWPV